MSNAMGRLSGIAVVGACVVCLVAEISGCRRLPGSLPKDDPPNMNVAGEAAGQESRLRGDAPCLRRTDRDPTGVFPMRYQTSTNTMHHGSFVESPDRSKRLVCQHVQSDAGLLSDRQFWLHDLTVEMKPQLAFSERKEFDPDGEVLLGGYEVVWSGNSEGLLVIRQGEDSDNRSARVFFRDLDGRMRELKSESFTSLGKIVGSVPGTRWLVTQTLELTPPPSQFRTRVRVTDERGTVLATYEDPEWYSTYFSDVAHDLLLYHSPFPNIGPMPVLYLVKPVNGVPAAIGVGYCARFRPKHDSVTYLAPNNGVYLLLEYQIEASRTRIVAAWPELECVEDYYWSEDGRTAYLEATLRGDASVTVCEATFE